MIPIYLLPEIYSNVSLCPVVRPQFLGRYYNTCNVIYNHNRMRHYDIALEEYWVTQSGYFRLATTVALGIGIKDGKLLYCHGVSVGNLDRKMLTLEYNNRMVYDYFNDYFTADCGIPALNISPIIFYDRPRLHKRARYTPYLLPAAISVASENSFSTLTTPSGSTDLLTSDDTNTLDIIKWICLCR